VTLNLGLRYEYSPWLNGYKGQIGTFDPASPKPIIVSGSGTVPDLSAQAAPTAYQFLVNTFKRPARLVSHRMLHMPIRPNSHPE
jgi:hypothetical protein